MSAEASPKSKGGKFKKLLLILTGLALLGGGVYLGVQWKSSQQKAGGEAAAQPPPKPKKQTPEQIAAERVTQVLVPITRSGITYGKARPMQEVVDYNNVYMTDAQGIPREIAVSDRITVSIQGSNGRKYIVTKLAVKVSSIRVISRINENRNRLFSAASSTLAATSMTDLTRPGLQSHLKSQLISAFHSVLGQGAIVDLIFEQFEVN